MGKNLKKKYLFFFRQKRNELELQKTHCQIRTGLKTKNCFQHPNSKISTLPHVKFETRVKIHRKTLLVNTIFCRSTLYF